MIKKTLILFFVTNIILTSCSSEAKSQSEKKYLSNVVDHLGVSFGMDYPKWLIYFLENREHEISTLYPEKIAIIYSTTGSNIGLLQKQGNTTGINKKIASMIDSAAMKDIQGKKYNKKTYSSKVEKTSQTIFKGLIKESEWWTLIENTNGSKEYNYYFFYLMDKKNFDEQVQTIIKELKPR